MKMYNRFCLTPGRIPPIYISRGSQRDEITASLLKSNPAACHACFITGVRGCGKTVELTSAANSFREKRDWIVIDLNPEKDLIEMTVAALHNHPGLIPIFGNARTIPVTDKLGALVAMLEELSAHGKRLLLTLDEIALTPAMKDFFRQLHSFLHRDCQVYLLMAGLSENIEELQGEEELSFLRDIPTVRLQPLELNLASAEYKRLFNLSDGDASAMAKVTKGYAFAFQVLGYLCRKRTALWTDVLPEYDEMLRDYVYDKIVSELSEPESQILRTVSQYDRPEISSVRASLSYDAANFAVYTNALIRKGLLLMPEAGYLEAVLPRF